MFESVCLLIQKTSISKQQTRQNRSPKLIKAWSSSFSIHSLPCSQLRKLNDFLCRKKCVGLCIKNQFLVRACRSGFPQGDDEERVSIVEYFRKGATEEKDHSKGVCDLDHNMVKNIFRKTKKAWKCCSRIYDWRELKDIWKWKFLRYKLWAYSM